MKVERVYELSPPRPALGLGEPLEVKLGQFASQVEECHGYGLRFPLETESGTQAERRERGKQWLNA